MHFSTLLPAALVMGVANAAYQGFNYGSTFTDNSPKTYQNFKDEFNTAKQLAGTNGAFSSARLYTMVQAGTSADPISALQAAVDTQTSLLLGVWASAGDASFANEITALKAAISAFPQLASQIAGISVGSEDLYRVSPIGIENESGIGVGPDVVTKYISEVRNALSGSSWSGVQVGHVDTWTAWVNGSNSAVVAASDFIGVDAYPYFQSTMSNAITSAKQLYNDAISATTGAAQGKPVWVTETGWPVSGPESNLAQANTDDAKTYWDEVGCPAFGNTNIWWYTLQDSAPTTPSPSFGVIGSSLTTTPLYDLSCSDIDTDTSSSSSPTSSATGSATSVPTSGALVPSGAGHSPSYPNATVSTVDGTPTTIVTATASGAAGSGGSGSGATATGGSGSGDAAGSGSPASPSVTTYAGSASMMKSSVAGILGAVAAAVMLL